MKKRLSEERIIGFLQEAEAGTSVDELYRRTTFRKPALALMQQVWQHERFRCQTREGTGDGERAVQATVGRTVEERGIKNLPVVDVATRETVQIVP